MLFFPRDEGVAGGIPKWAAARRFDVDDFCAEVGQGLACLRSGRAI